MRRANAYAFAGTTRGVRTILRLCLRARAFLAKSWGGGLLFLTTPPHLLPGARDARDVSPRTGEDASFKRPPQVPGRGAQSPKQAGGSRFENPPASSSPRGKGRAARLSPSSYQGETSASPEKGVTCNLILRPSTPPPNARAGRGFLENRVTGLHLREKGSILMAGKDLARVTRFYRWGYTYPYPIYIEGNKGLIPQNILPFEEYSLGC